MSGQGINLFNLGLQRLENKKQRMRNLLKIALPDEALYREIMLSLGYKHNKLPFLELATLLPFSEIRKLGKRELIEKAMLYRAGFIDDKSAIPDFFDFSLRMSRDVWTYKGTRPANFPEKRISQISYLLAESIEKGIFLYFKDKIETAFCNELTLRNVKGVVNKIMSFNGLGESRKLDMFFNIMVPFFIVIYESDSEQRLCDFLKKIIEIYPLTEGNKRLAEKLNKKLSIEKIQIASVIEFFGLLELSKDKGDL